MSTSLGGKDNDGFDLGCGYNIFLDKLKSDDRLGIRVPLLCLGSRCFELDVI